MRSWIQFTFAMLLIAFSVSTFAAGTVSTTGYGRVIVFGDSLSDVGTYAAAKLKGGGKFTTNPGALWAEVVAAKFGLPMRPNREEGFGLPVHIVGGFNYAQGGARITAPYHKVASEAQTLTARPLVEQVGLFISAHQNFNSDDLVLIQGGPNDVFAQLSQLKAGKITMAEAMTNLTQAAQELTNIVLNIKNHGGQKVVVINLPAIEKTPKVLAVDANAQQVVALLVSTFNQALASDLTGQNITAVNLYSFDIQFNQTAAQMGFKDITHPGCRVSVLPLGSSLFCNDKTLVEPGSNLTYKFADEIHPATGYSKVVGEFIYSEILK